MNKPFTPDITVETIGGMTILRSLSVKPKRRVLYLNSYGMAVAWRQYTQGEYPSQHLWGCVELVSRGYEIAMPEEIPQNGRFFNYRRQDFNHIKFALDWLRPGDIVYSAHTILFWLPLLRRLRMHRFKLVTLLYAAGESLKLPLAYDGILALTPAALSRALVLAPHAKITNIGWGLDFNYYPKLPYSNKWFLSCGKTRRDFRTLAASSQTLDYDVRIINTVLPADIEWSKNVKTFTGGTSSSWQTVSYNNLVHQQYEGCSAALIVLQPDPEERFAAGFTQLLEAAALGKPVIVTRTGAIPSEFDVETLECGIFVNPGDPASLREAMKTIIDDPDEAKRMGEAGRKVCLERYDTHSFSKKLDEFFDSL